MEIRIDKPVRTLTEELIKLYLGEIMHGDNAVHGITNERQLCDLIWGSEKLAKLYALLNDYQDKDSSHFISSALLLELADEAYVGAFDHGRPMQ